MKVTLTFNTEDQNFIDLLRQQWLNDKGIKMIVAGGGPRHVDLTTVQDNG